MCEPDNERNDKKSLAIYNVICKNETSVTNLYSKYFGPLDKVHKDLYIGASLLICVYLQIALFTFSNLHKSKRMIVSLWLVVGAMFKLCSGRLRFDDLRFRRVRTTINHYLYTR